MHGRQARNLYDRIANPISIETSNRGDKEKRNPYSLFQKLTNQRKTTYCCVYVTETEEGQNIVKREVKLTTGTIFFAIGWISNHLNSQVQV